MALSILRHTLANTSFWLPALQRTTDLQKPVGPKPPVEVLSEKAMAATEETMKSLGLQPPPYRKPAYEDMTGTSSAKKQAKRHNREIAKAARQARNARMAEYRAREKRESRPTPEGWLRLFPDLADITERLRATGGRFSKYLFACCSTNLDPTKRSCVDGTLSLSGNGTTLRPSEHAVFGRHDEEAPTPVARIDYNRASNQGITYLSGDTSSKLYGEESFHWARDFGLDWKRFRFGRMIKGGYPWDPSDQPSGGHSVSTLRGVLGRIIVRKQPTCGAPLCRGAIDQVPVLGQAEFRPPSFPGTSTTEFVQAQCPPAETAASSEAATTTSAETTVASEAATTTSAETTVASEAATTTSPETTVASATTTTSPETTVASEAATPSLGRSTTTEQHPAVERPSIALLAGIAVGSSVATAALCGVCRLVECVWRACRGSGTDPEQDGAAERPARYEEVAELSAQRPLPYEEVADNTPRARATTDPAAPRTYEEIPDIVPITQEAVHTEAPRTYENVTPVPERRPGETYSRLSRPMSGHPRPTSIQEAPARGRAATYDTVAS